MSDDLGHPRQLLSMSQAALAYAFDFEHIREHGENRGAAVEFFLRCADVPPGAPWCAAFVNACAELAAAIRDKEPSPLEQVKREAYVPDYVAWAKRHGRTVPFSECHPGDLFALWNERKQRHAHIGFVYRPASDHYLTIEGNTNEEGSREGVRVMVRHRGPPHPKDVFIRWAD